MNATVSRLRQVYLRAIEIADPDQRCRFVDECCSDDPELGLQLRRLLDQSEVDSDFMSVPAVLKPELVAEFGQPASESLQPGTVIERYQLLRQLGHGGMGTVFQARQMEPVERLVALKVLRCGLLTAGTAACVEAERQTLADLKHPGIVSVLDAGQLEDGRPWFVMDYVEGASLTTFCREQRLSLEGRLQLMIDLCDAVRHAHFRGIIHQDLKPSNVLVELVDGRPICRLIDFGIRRDLGSSSEFAEPHGGTPDYMSPEQACGSSGSSGRADTRSDVFALGRILAEVVFGCPRAADSAAGGSAAVESAGDLSLSGRHRRELHCIIRLATRERPADRYATAEELSDDLRRLLSGRAVRAIPDDRLYRIGRFAARYKLLLSLAVLTLTSLTAGLLVSIQQMRAARAAERRANGYLEEAEQQGRQLRLLAWNSSLRQAWTAWETGQLAEARRMLDLCIPPTTVAPEQHAEWRILQTQMQSTIATRRICSGAVNELRPVPGKDLVAAACADGCLRLIRIQTGEVEQEVPSGIDSLHALAVDATGRRVAVGGSVDKVTDRSRVRICELDTKTWRDASPPQFTTIETLAFSDDGRFLLCGARYQPPLILRADDGSVVTTLPTDRRNLWGAISHNGDRAIVSASDQVVFVADLPGTQIAGDHGQSRIFPDQQHVLSGFFFGDSGRPGCLVDATDSLLLYDIDSQRMLASLEFSGKPECVQPGFDRKSLLITTLSGEILSWDLTKLHTTAPRSLHGEPEEPQRRLGDDWIPSLRPAARWLIEDEPVTSICDHSDILLAGTRSGDLHVMPRSPASWKPLNIVHPQVTQAAVQQLKADTERDAILLGYTNGAVIRLNPREPAEAGDASNDAVLFPHAHSLEEVFQATMPPQPLSGIAFTPQTDRHVRWLQQSGQLWVQQVQEPGESELLAEHNGLLESNRNELLRYSPDSAQLAYTLNRTLHVVSTSNPAEKSVAPMFPGNVNAFCWHPDGESLLIAGAFRGLMQWFPKTGRQSLLPGETDEIHQLAVSSDSRLLVSGDRGGRVAVWDLSAEQPQFRTASQIHLGEIYAMCLLDHGRIGVSVDEHFEVVLWMTDSGRRLGRLAKLPGACLHGIDTLELFTTPEEERLILAWLRMEHSVQTCSWDLHE